MKKILIFDAYPSIRELLAEELAGEGNMVVPVGNPDLIPELITTFDPDLFILDPYIRGGMTWELFDAVKAKNPDLPIFLFTHWASPDPHFDRAEAYLPKSYSLGKLADAVKKIPARRLRKSSPRDVSPPKKNEIIN